MTKRTFNASEAEAAAANELATANEIRTGLLASLARGKDVTADLAAIEDEVRAHKQTLARFTEAKQVAAVQESKAARQAKHDTLANQLAVALTEAAELASEAAKIVAYFEKLAPKLQHIAELRASVSKKLHAAAHEASRGAHKEYEIAARLLDNTSHLLNGAIDRLTAPTYVAAAVGRSGLGTVGVNIPDAFVRVNGVNATDTGYEFRDPSKELTKAVSKLGEIAAQIESWSLTANGLKE